MARRHQHRHGRATSPTEHPPPELRGHAAEPPLSPTAQRNIDLALAHGWSTTTKAGYASAIRHFIAFCEDEGFNASSIFPASENALCAFAASHARTRAGSTARNNLAAVKAWHAYHNATWQGGARLKYILSGVTNLAPLVSKRPKRAPVTTAMLDILVRDLDHKHPFDACVLATALTAFWGQCRLGELLPFATTADAAKRPRVIDIKLRPTRGEEASTLHLPSTKNSTARGEDVALISRMSEIVDTPRALLHHSKVSKLVASDPLFSYCAHGHSALRRLTTNAFLARCNEIWTGAGLPRTTGHAFRIGGTTELLIAGVESDVVRAMGRWSSDAYLKYWRSLEQLVPRRVHHILNRGRAPTVVA